MRLSSCTRMRARLLSLILCLSPAVPLLAESVRPNVIFILTDDLGYSDVEPPPTRGR
jgi:hypothetical protein